MAAQLEQQPTEAAESAPPSPPPSAGNGGGGASPTSVSAPPQAPPLQSAREPQQQQQPQPLQQQQQQPQPQQQPLTSEDVDSALLSALRDPRERMALLKLERVLVGFMRERTTGYIEVGGQYNSIVIGGGAKVAGAAGASGGGAGGSGGGGGGSGGSSGASGAASKTVVQPQGAGRQTTFQRLCLHRLADRFGIVREAASTVLEYEGDGGGNSGGGPGNNGMGGPGFQPTLIRLVKTKDSKIPPKLLIDLDPAAYSPIGGGDGSKADDAGVRSISRDLSSSRLSDMSDKGARGKSPIPTSSGPPSKPRKMVIMKRSSSKLGTGSNNSLTGEGGSKGKRKSKLKGKHLSDKEKAYAEARARILGEHADNDGGEEGMDKLAPHEERRRSSNDDVGGSSAAGSPSGSPPPSRSGSASQLSPPKTDAGEGGEVIAQEQPPPKEKEGGNEQRRRRGGDRSSYNKRDSSNPNSKVTWRNRRQEESDPDFRRGGSMVLNPGPSPAAVAVQGPLHAQQPAIVHYGAAGPVAMGYAYANGGAVTAPIMVAPAPMGHHTVGIHAQQQLHRGGGAGASPVAADGKVFFQQQQQHAAAMQQQQQQYYYQPPAQAQPYMPQQTRGVYQYQQPPSRGYYAQGQQQFRGGGGKYTAAQRAVADVHSMEEFPSLGGGGGGDIGDSSGGNSGNGDVGIGSGNGNGGGEK